MRISKKLLPILLITLSIHTAAQDPPPTPLSLPDELLLLERERVCRRHVTKLVKPTYPEDAQKAGIEGQVLAFVWFDKDGKLVEPQAWVVLEKHFTKKKEWKPKIIRGEWLIQIGETETIDITR